MNTKHNKLPWIIDVQSADTPWIIDDLDGNSIALVFPVTGDDLKHSKQSANTEFIIRACNHYYELLEACKKAYNLLRFIGSGKNIDTPAGVALEQIISRLEETHK